MACCAAAAFFIAQIVLAFESVRRRMFRASMPKTRRNNAVMWTPGSVVVEDLSTTRRAHKLIVAALMAEALLVAGTAMAWSSLSAPDGARDAVGERDLWSLAMDSICTSDPLAESRGRLNNSIEGNAK